VVHVHDVVIVGAGPGGSATAHFASKRGLDVLLLDRATFPRDKTCGDGLTPRALRILDTLGLLPQTRARGFPIQAYEVVAPNGKATTANIGGPHQALVVPRLILDQFILESAIRSGATFEPNTNAARVEPTAHGARVVTDDGRTFEGRVAVVASGAATGVLTRSGILPRQPRAMLAARTYFEGFPRELEASFQLRFDNVPSPGYGWIFPTGTHSANVGVGFWPKRGSGTAVQAFHRFATHLPGGSQVGPVKGYPIRVDFLRSPTHAKNTLLVGEAAGLVNPLTGEGIDYALESGQMAAEHVVQGLSSGVDETWGFDYDRLLRERFEKVFRFSEWIRDWYCKPGLLNLLVPLASRRPELRQRLATIVLGERDPRGYGPATMAARLAWYLMRNPRGAVPAHD
jgi:geranylgeranyl reductase family protein